MLPIQMEKSLCDFASSDTNLSKKSDNLIDLFQGDNKENNKAIKQNDW